MRFVELHDYRDDSVSIASDLIASVEGVDSPYLPNQRTVVRIRMGDKLHSLAIRESYAEVMALIAGTATAAQEAAERADLDERLEDLERKGTLNDGLQHMNESLILEMASRIGKTEARLTLLAGVDIAVLEDSIGGVSKRQGETYSDVCGLAERIKQVEDGLAELTQQTSQEQHTNDHHYEQQGDRIVALEQERLPEALRELQQSHQALLEEVAELERKMRNLAADVPVVE